MNPSDSFWTHMGFDLGAASELAWLLSLPVALLLLVAGYRRRQHRLGLVQGFMRRGGLKMVGSRVILKGILHLLALAAIVVALARPRWGFDWVEVRRKGVDLVIAVDVSQSMLATDISPSRLSRAKRAVSDFLDVLKGDRVGLVAFAGSAYVQCPLTEDYGAIRMFMDYLDPSLIPVQGTDLGAAVSTSLQALTDGGEASKDAKAVVIMTDGEDLEAGIDKAVAKAKEQGVRLYAIGIGTPEGGPIPIPGGGFKKDSQGQVILTKPDESALAKMALDTGGMYVRSVPGGEDLKKIYEEGISVHLQKREFETNRERLWHERFQWFLALALILLAVEWMIPEVLPVAGAFTLFLAVGGGLHADLGYAADPRSAHDAFAEGRYGVAAKEFLDAEIDEPEDAGHAYNRAVSQYREGKFAEAAEGFTKAAAKSQDQHFVGRSMFNLGNARVAEGKLDDAIKAYEAVLEINPQDQQARENLEYVKNLKDQKQNQEQNSPNSPPPPNQENQQNRDNQQNQGQNNSTSPPPPNQENQQKRDNQQNQGQNNSTSPPPSNQENSENPQQKNPSPQGQKDSQTKGGGDQSPDQDQDSDQDRNKERQEANSQDGDQSKAQETEKKNHDTSSRPAKAQSPKGKTSDAEAERLLRAVEDQAGKYLFDIPQGRGESPRPEKDW